MTRYMHRTAKIDGYIVSTSVMSNKIDRSQSSIDSRKIERCDMTTQTHRLIRTTSAFIVDYFMDDGIFAFCR